MHITLKPILFTLLYLIGILALERFSDLNELVSVWKFLYSYPIGKELWDVICWGPSILVAIFSVVYFRRKIKTICLRDLFAAVIAILLAYTANWIQIWFRYNMIINPFFFGTEPRDPWAQFYFNILLSVQILGTATICACSLCFLKDALGKYRAE